MKSLRPFIPGFLKRYDDRLLKNKPGLWTDRLHLVLYYFIIGSVVTGLLSYLFFNEPREENSSGFLAVFITVISILGLIFWIIYLLRFNVFKRYGILPPMDGLFTFVRYFLCVAAIISLPFIPSFVESVVANSKYPDKEIAKDINEINLAAATLEKHTISNTWRRDTITVFQQYPIVVNGDTAWEPEYYNYNNSGSGVTVVTTKHYVGSHNLKDELNQTDSVIKVNDSIYYTFRAPALRIVEPYTITNHIQQLLWNNKELYYKSQSNPVNNNILVSTLSKYKIKYAGTVSDYYYQEPAPGMENTKSKYRIQEMDTIIQRIVSKKDSWRGHYEFILRLFFYLSFVISMLVYIFRHSTRRTFFISLLVCILLTILTSLFIALSGGGEVATLMSLLFYFVLFGIISFTVFSAKQRTVLHGVALNLFFYMFAFMPMVVYATIVESTNYGYTYDHQPYNYAYLYLAEIGGFVLLLILMQPVFRRLYRFWYALPEE